VNPLYLFGAILVGVLLVYLALALFRPEKF
jgi:K+-transporting ATPase KdpF subunit